VKGCCGTFFGSGGAKDSATDAGAGSKAGMIQKDGFFPLIFPLWNLVVYYFSIRTGLPGSISWPDRF